MRKGAVLSVVLTACLLLPFCGDAGASMISIDLRATVTRVDGPAPLAPGDIITGSYLYESDVPRVPPYHPGYARYRDSSPASGFRLESNGLVFASATAYDTFHIIILDDFTDYTGTYDGYYVESVNNRFPGSPEPFLTYILFGLRDTTTSALPGIYLPTTPPNLARWAENALHIDCEGSPGGYFITAEVTSVGFTPVPGPATGILLLSGLLVVRRAKGTSWCNQVKRKYFPLDR